MNEYTNLKRILQDLKDIVERENKRHLMDGHLTLSTLALLEEEIIPLLQDELDYDPSPQHLYDNTGGEPAVSAKERHQSSWIEHQMAKRGLIPQG